MLKDGAEDNLADIGTTGHDKAKLEKLSKLNNLIDMDVEEYHEAVVASVANVSSVKSSSDLRAALAAVVVAASAYLPPAEATAQICICLLYTSDAADE